MGFFVASFECKSTASERPFGAGGGDTQAAAGCSVLVTIIATAGGVGNFEVGQGHAEEGERCEEGRFDKHCSVRVWELDEREREEPRPLFISWGSN